MKEDYKSRSKSRKKKSSKLPIIVFFILVIAIFVYLIVFNAKPKEKSEQNKLENELLGSWTTDGYTTYEFYEDGKGALKIPVGDYNFFYTTENNRISIDFENEKSIDSDYEFSFEDGILILKGINNTSGIYKFTKYK